MTTEEPMLEAAITGLKLCAEMHRASEALSGCRASHAEFPVKYVEAVVEALSRTPPVDQDEVERVAKFIEQQDVDWSGRPRETISRELIRQVLEAMSALIGSGAGNVREALIDWRNCWLCPATNFDDQVPRLLAVTAAALSTDTGSGG